jgi:hypothetical protein
MIESRGPAHLPLDTNLEPLSQIQDSACPVASLCEDFLGDRIRTSKPPNTTRMHFQNVNGLNYTSSGGEFNDICAQIHKDNINILGIAETKLDTQRKAVVPTCLRSARRTFSSSRVVLSSSAISYSSPFKPGGTALITAGCTTGRITNTHQDPMGRWCATTYRGAQTREVTVISAYQVCNTPPDRDLRGHGTSTTGNDQHFGTSVDSASKGKVSS